MESSSSRGSSKVEVHIKNLNIILKNQVFDGNYPITIFDFFTCFVNEDNMLNIAEEKALIDLPNVLADPPEIKFRANMSGASHKVVITCWTESIQYLLRTYAPAPAISDVLEDLRNVKNKECEQ